MGTGSTKAVYFKKRYSKKGMRKRRDSNCDAVKVSGELRAISSVTRFGALVIPAPIMIVNKPTRPNLQTRTKMNATIN
jgi:hypothetical protein